MTIRNLYEMRAKLKRIHIELSAIESELPKTSKYFSQLDLPKAKTPIAELIKKLDLICNAYELKRRAK